MTLVRDESWRRSRGVYALPSEDQRPTAVYIHVPFCLHRCGYCDFTLVAGRDDLVSRYLTAIGNELREMREFCSVATIHIGGGTPTHLTPQQLGSLLTEVRSHFALRDDGEFAVEANPDGLTTTRLAVLADHGVNRLSLGVQSFDPLVLATLERSHTPQDALTVIERANTFLDNISVDLIFGVPDQTHAVWESSLRTAVDLPIQHVSAYGLTFEKGTAFHQQRSANQFRLQSSDDERQQYAAAMAILSDAGFEQYEISNFARSGFRSSHNEMYWDAREYFAFGPGAARYVGGVRSTNGRHVERWISSWEQGIPLLQEIEQLSAEEKAREAVMLGLRRNRGICLEEFQRRFGCSIESLAGEALQRHLQGGLLELTASEPPCLRLTEEGRFLADTVIVDFL